MSMQAPTQQSSFDIGGPTRRSLLIVALAVACSAGCDGSDRSTAEATTASEIKVFRYSMNGAPTSLDPVQTRSVYANFVVLNAFDTLYSYKYLARPYRLKPNLATDLPEISEDKLTYTIRLKPGVHFIDDPAFEDGIGREVTAADFVYSIQRHFDPAMRPQGAWLWQGRIAGLVEWKAAGSDYAQEVDGLKALDRYTVQIRLTRPYPQLVYTLAMGYSALVPREAVERYGREFAIRPVGSGPFKILSFNTAKVVFVRNPRFRAEPVDIWSEGYDPAAQSFTGVERIDGRAPPFLDRLEIDFISEGSARWSSFTKGDEIQYAGLPDEQVDLVLESKDPVTLKDEYADKFHMHAGLEAGFVFTTFNMDFEEFGYSPEPNREHRNRLLRCAVRKGFDWNRRNESFYMDIARVFPGVILPAVPEFDPDMPDDSIRYDPEGARQLLAEGGWTPENLPILTYGTVSSVKSRLFYEQFRAWMKIIGYPAEKIVLKRYATFGDITRAWSRSELPFNSKGWLLDFPDAENTLQLFYGPNGSPGSNDANYSNPEYDSLFERASVMLPSPERTEIYQRMNQILIDDCVTISGMSRVQIMLWHKDVIAMPDSSIVGGFFLRYVDIDTGDPHQALIPE
jgi:ABC-type transport system substrate-binding protein